MKQEFSSIEQQLVHEGQYLTVLHGTSMWPMIRFRKDPVLLVPLKTVRSDGKARRGDVVAYRLSDRFVVHRVLKVCSDHYVIRGDNCLFVERVPHDAVFAIVVRWWRNGHCYSTGDFRYRGYVAIWLALHPFFRLLKRARRKFRQ